MRRFKISFPSNPVNFTKFCPLESVQYFQARSSPIVSSPSVCPSGCRQTSSL